MIEKTFEPYVTYRLLCDDKSLVVDGFINVCPKERKIKIVFEISEPYTKDDLEGAYLVVDSNGEIQYRAIYDCCTDILASTLSNGTVKLAVSAGVIKKVWKCENLTIQHLDNGMIAMIPYDLDAEKKISNITVALSEMSRRLRAAEEKTASFDERLTEIMNGYDLV